MADGVYGICINEHLLCLQCKVFVGLFSEFTPSNRSSDLSGTKIALCPFPYTLDINQRAVTQFSSSPV